MSPMDEKPLAVCPVCKRKVFVRHDGTMPYHDNVPPCRSLCSGSLLTLPAARLLAAELDAEQAAAREREKAAE